MKPFAQGHLEHGGEDSPQACAAPQPSPSEGGFACSSFYFKRWQSGLSLSLLSAEDEECRGLAPAWWRVGGLSHTGTTRGLLGFVAGPFCQDQPCWRGGVEARSASPSLVEGVDG